MALFCKVTDEMHHRYNEWGFVKERTFNRAFIVFELGSGCWFDVSDLELFTWGDTPEHVIERYFVN